MKKALIIKADGSLPTVREILSDETTYEVIKATIASERGDWFDCVRGTRFHIYVNDTGLIDGLPINMIASIVMGQVICGDVIAFGSFSPEDEYDGEEHDIPDWVVKGVRSQWMLMRENEEARTVLL